MTSATNPSLEDLLRGSLPGIPPIVLYNPVLAFETGDELHAGLVRRRGGRLDPFMLVLEGSVPNEELNGDGHWAGMGVDPETGQPIPTNSWIDRLAPRAAAVLALGTCAAYGGVPAMRNNPTGAMGLRDYLGGGWTSRLGIPVVNLPGCPVQPDNITQTLLAPGAPAGAASRPPIDLDAQGRPVELFGRTVHESCNRAGFADQAEFSEQLGDGQVPGQARLQRARSSGATSRCAGWVNGVGGCPNVGGICIGVHRRPGSPTGSCRSRTPTASGWRLRALRASPTALCSRTSATAGCARRTNASRPGGAPRPSCSRATRDAGDRPMPVRVIFRCQFCPAAPDPETQRSLERQLRELVCGEYLDALPGRWLVWHGRGPFGPTRYACAEHRGDLTAYLREHYGTLGWQPWKMPPYPITRRSRDTDRALRLRALSPGSSWGPRA